LPFRSRGDAVVIFQHPTQTLATADFALPLPRHATGINEPVVQALMIALAVIVSQKRVCGILQRGLAKEDDSIEACRLTTAIASASSISRQSDEIPPAAVPQHQAAPAIAVRRIFLITRPATDQ
jgi:hypothetical protein